MAVRVLHIITQLELGGAQKNVLEILSILSRDKYDIHLISSKGLLSSEARRIPGIRLTFLPFLKRQPNPFWDVLAFLALVVYIKREGIQVVHTHSSKAGILGRWAAKVSGVAVIVHSIHGWGFHDYLKSLFNDLYIFLEKITAKITTKLIAVSENDINRGLNSGIGHRGQYSLIRYAIDSNLSTHDGKSIEHLRYQLGLGEDKIVAMVACLKPQKNPMDFVVGADLVLKRRPNTKFLLIGDGSLRPALERQIKRRNLENSFLMLGWRRDVPQLMPLLDVCVLTSLWEGMPLVFLEAMSCRKPVVAYDICGLSELIKDGVNGFLVRPKDTLELSQRITLLLEDDDLRDRMGRFAQHTVSADMFSLRSMARQITHLYEECMNKA